MEEGEKERKGEKIRRKLGKSFLHPPVALRSLFLTFFPPGFFFSFYIFPHDISATIFHISFINLPAINLAAPPLPPPQECQPSLESPLLAGQQSRQRWRWWRWWQRLQQQQLSTLNRCENEAKMDRDGSEWIVTIIHTHHTYFWMKMDHLVYTASGLWMKLVKRCLNRLPKTFQNVPRTVHKSILYMGILQ